MRYLLFFICCFWSSVALASEDFALYTSIEPMSLSKKEVKKILIGQQSTWENGEDVVILLYPNTSPQMTYLCDEIIGIPEMTYRRFIIEKAFRSGLKLVEIEAYKNVKDAIKDHPGAIVVFDNNERSIFEEENKTGEDTDITIHPITLSK